MNRLLPSLILVIIFYTHAFSDIVLYLKSTAPSKDDLTISDVAVIDGNEASLVNEIAISQNAKMDGFITRNEVHHLIKENVKGLIVIHGNSVKLLSSTPYDLTDSFYHQLSPAQHILTIKKGDTITVRLINKSIVIELKGTALESGKTGEEIRVALDGGKTIAAKIGINSVESYL